MIVHTLNSMCLLTLSEPSILYLNILGKQSQPVPKGNEKIEIEWTPWEK